MDFTDSQERAIRSVDDHLQIIACAGSGKTRVLVERICYILQNRPDIKPENIIAFTFTEKAAAELKNRIDQAVKQKGISSLGMADMYVGTIHGFCLDFLQQNCLKFQKYSILNEIQTKLFVQKNDKKALQVNISPMGKASKSLTLPKDTALYLSIISMIREEQLLSHRDLPGEWKDSYKKYDNLFHEYCYFDFSMIIETAVQELQKPERRAYIKENIKYLIVDEYQDLNPLQEALLKIFHEYGVNICVVGDDDQTIYQWRGSNTGNFLDFPKRYNIPQEDIIYLDTNFRSTDKIIQMAEEIISKNMARFHKQFQSGNGVLNYQQNHDLFYKEFNNHEAEAEFIAGEVKKLADGGMPLSEIAVLTRKKILNQPILEALSKKGIPVIVEGVAELFAQPVTRAAEAVFGYLNNTISKDILGALWREAAPFLEESALEAAVKKLDQHRAGVGQKWELNLQEIFREFLQAAEFHRWADKKACEILFYNLGQFSVLLGDFESIYFKTPSQAKLDAFARFIIHLAQDAYAEGELLNMYIKPEAVQIMTIHKSKGLEFGAVFVPGLSKNTFPPKGHGGLGVQHYLDIEHLVEGGERYLKSTTEDERRLFYVAITRAKKFLYLSRARTYLKNDGGVNVRDYQSRSLFLQEALDIIGSPFVQTTPPTYTVPPALTEAKKEANTSVNFSLLNSYFQCPFLFKLDHFYNFQSVIDERLGFGKSLHDMIKELHLRGAGGEALTSASLPEIVDRHFHMPYANDYIKENQKAAIARSLGAYFDKYGHTFKDIQFIEQKIEIPLSDTLLVSGRIDLIKSKDGSVEIIDFKTGDSIPNTREQLLIYAKGYQQLTGRRPDIYHVYNVDDNKTIARDAFTEGSIAEITQKIVEAADNIKTNRLPKCGDAKTCKTCHKRQFCHAEDK